MLVFKFLENKGTEREEIREGRAERNDRNKPEGSLKKMMRGQ